MHQNFSDFQTKFKTQEFNIYQSDHWVWSLRPVHSTLGAGVLSLKRYCEKMSDMTLAESEDLGRITKIIEASLMKSFSYDRINYLMLMMVDPHLHFHVFPRYNSERFFGDIGFVDSGWPKLPELTAPSVETTVLHEIKDLIIKNIS